MITKETFVRAPSSCFEKKTVLGYQTARLLLQNCYDLRYRLRLIEDLSDHVLHLLAGGPVYFESGFFKRTKKPETGISRISNPVRTVKNRVPDERQIIGGWPAKENSCARFDSYVGNAGEATRNNARLTQTSRRWPSRRAE